MNDKNDVLSRKKELDDFWNIDLITPKKAEPSLSSKKSTDTVEVTVSSVLESLANDNVYRSEKITSVSESGVIQKIVTPDYKSGAMKSEAFEFEYSPKSSLIHKVKVFKWRLPYNYYEDFFQDALRLKDREGEAAERVSFFSYVPQYDQLNKKQMAYYLYFRSQARNQIYIDADYSYILLYIYEILNLGDNMDTAMGQAQLCGIWKAYRKKYPRINKQLIEWICDYSLINKLPPPDSIDVKSVSEICALKEFFVIQSGNDYTSYADILLAFSSAYDYHTSKFAIGENLKIYDEYIPLALSKCIKHLSKNGVLSDVGFNDSLLPRDAYSGALCSHRIKRRIEIEYCSFSKTNDLRYLVGDIVKYSENKIRAYLGIKPRLSCYSLDADIRSLLDEFFKVNLSKAYKPRQKEKKKEYDLLYDLPAKPLSLSDAALIEEESWETTRSLVEAFDEDKESDNNVIEIIDKSDAILFDSLDTEADNEENDIVEALGELFEFVKAVYSNDVNSQKAFARQRGQMPDSIVDAVNAISADVIGDILIEDIDGVYSIIDDYKSYFTELEK